MKSIRDVYNQEMKSIGGPLLEMNWKNKQTYAEFLAQTYFYILYSTRIISLAGAHFGVEQNDLHNRFIEHTREEKNHDKMLLLDLKELGHSIEDFTPNHMTKCLYQTQYYWIQNEMPISVYGYFLFLEGLAIEFGPGIMKQLKTVYPEKATRFLKVHIEEDQDHMKEHFGFLEKISTLEQKKIIENLQEVSQIYKGMLEQVEAHSKLVLN